MSELCLSSTPKTQFPSLLLSHLIFLCSFILSHPLYFSYFIFFSPYLLKLLSFLSPLFITTSLLLLALLTISPPEFSDSGFLLSMYHTILERLRSSTDDEEDGGGFPNPEEFEAFRIVFDTCTFDVRGNPMEEKSFFKELDVNVEEKKIVPPPSPSPPSPSPPPPPMGPKSNKVVEEHKEESLVKIGSEAEGIKISDYNTIKVDSDVNYVNGFSMRKEKEWKRTLACKLFEERHNVEGDEGMDSLWERYELDSSKTKKKNIKKGGIEYFDQDDDDEDEDEEEETNAQLCCLQALKFSAGKMNLGMGRPNLVKISKALKGFGWLHHVTRHGKKSVPLR